MPYKFVMLVDHDEVDSIVSWKILESNNFAERISAFRTGQEGLDYLKANKSLADALPEMIFLELNMPGIDGFQFLEEFAKIDGFVHERCKIILLTSTFSPRDIDRAASNRFVRKYLDKPLNSRKLEAIST